MYAIMGITGQVGGAAARTLLANGQSVRAIVRDPSKAARWAAVDAEVAVADFRDPDALQSAFAGVDGVFVMNPPNFAPEDNFPETRAIIAAIRRALEVDKPPKIVCLSSVGAHRPKGLGLITTLYILEQELGSLPMPSAFVRAGWFMENSQWDIPIARETGEMPSFLQPLDRRIPMVATSDVGRVIAETLQQTWLGKRIIEIDGPRQYSPNDIAAIFESLLGRSVQAIAVPREQWATFFEDQGAAPHTTAPRIEMLDGFNSGWIDFERQGTEYIVGRVPMEEVLGIILASSSK